MQTTPSAVIRSSSGGLKRGEGALGWMTWNAALVLLIAVFVTRVLYLIFLTPYELVGDEAYYWQQARHLDWCYDEKGPVLAWMIAGCCRLLGDHQWTVRLPVVIAALVAGWGIGRIAMEVSDGDERVGFFAVLIFCLLPAFQANAQLCTQDGPLIALWVGLTAVGLRLVRRWSTGQTTWGDWMLLWAVLALGFYLKQTVLLFLPSLAIYWLLNKCTPRLAPRWFLQQIVGVALFIVIISPMLFWNQRHGWPMLAHTAGHLGAGGDQAGSVQRGNAFTWLGGTLGGIVGAFGPAFVVLAVWASRRAWGEVDPARWRDRMWLVCAAWPGAIFFVLLSVIKPVVPSWPLPHLVPLVASVALLAAVELPRARALKTETPFRRMWGVLLVYGILGWLVISFPTVLAYLPVIGAKLDKSVISRFSGHREEARQLHAVLTGVTTPDGKPPIVVTRYYMPACLYAFYLPDHPTVTTAQRYLGRRATTLDQWPDTDLANPALRGRTLLLVGPDVPWDRALRFDKIEPVPSDPRFLLGSNFQGPR